MAQVKPAKNKAKPKKKMGLYAAAAQKRQDNINKALGDTGSGKVKRKKFAGAGKKK